MNSKQQRSQLRGMSSRLAATNDSSDDELAEAGYPTRPPTKEQIVAAARIVVPTDTLAPVPLRAMADSLDEALEEAGYTSQNGQTFHVVHWPAAGLVIAVHGNPTNEKAWH